MVKSKTFPIGRWKLLEGVDLCRKKSKQLVNNAQFFLKDKKNHPLAFALYTFAIEEFGKELLLKELLEENKRHYEIPQKIFGRRYGKSHEEKIKRALSSNLPPECKKINLNFEITAPAIIGTTIFYTDEGRTRHSVSENITTTWSEKSLIDNRLRDLCFYVDWNPRKKDWKPELDLDESELKRAIIKFQEFLNNLPKNFDH